MLIYKQFTIGQISIELGDIGFGIGNIRGATEVVTMIEESLFSRGIAGHIAVSCGNVFGVGGRIPLHGRSGRRARLTELGRLRPAFGHAVVAQLADNRVVAHTGIFWVCIIALHRRNARRRAELLVILLTLRFYVLHPGSIITLSCRNYISIDAINVIELSNADFRGNALVADEVVLGKAVFIYTDDRGRIQSIVVMLMKGDPLRCAVDIDTLHRAMALDDAFAAGIVGITARLAVVRKHHQPVVLVPIHLARVAR